MFGRCVALGDAILWTILLRFYWPIMLVGIARSRQWPILMHERRCAWGGLFQDRAGQ